MNIVCEGDGRKTRGIIAQVVFSILTLGIYNLIWVYAAGDRIFFNCTKRNIPEKKVLWICQKLFSDMFHQKR